MRHDAPKLDRAARHRLPRPDRRPGRRAGVDRGLHRRRVVRPPGLRRLRRDGRPGFRVVRDLRAPAVLLRRVGRRRELRPRVAAAGRRGLAPLLLRPLGVDDRGLALGVRRALGLGGVPLRAVGARPVLRLGLGAGVRVGAGVGLVADLGRRHRLGAARARALGLRDRVPLRRLLVDLRPDRAVRVDPRLHRRVRPELRAPLVPLHRAVACAPGAAPRGRPARAGARPRLGWPGAAAHRRTHRPCPDARPDRRGAFARRPGAARRDLGLPSRCALLRAARRRRPRARGLGSAGPGP